MKHYTFKIILGVVLCLLVLNFPFTNVDAYNWSDSFSGWGSVGTHGLMTREALSILRNYGSQQFRAYGDLAYMFLPEIINGDRNEDADGGKIDLGPLGTFDKNGMHHFLDPMDHGSINLTSLGLDGLLTNESAADVAQKMYDSAVSAWKSGNYTYAMDRLGHALHLVQDVTVSPSHAEPHNAFDHKTPHDDFENTAQEIMKKIYRGELPRTKTFVNYSYISNDKANYFTGTDFYASDHESGHYRLKVGDKFTPAWAYVDAAAHFAWQYLPYIIPGNITLDDDFPGDTGDYFWTRDLVKGDDGTLIMRFYGASYIDVDFDEIDMTNYVYDTLGMCELYDKYGMIYSEDRDFFAPTVRVWGDTAKIRAYVNEDSFWDSDVDGYEIDKIIIGNPINPESYSSFYINGSYYTMKYKEYAAYQCLTKAVQLSTGLVLKFFWDTASFDSASVAHYQGTLSPGSSTGWLGPIYTPADVNFITAAVVTNTGVNNCNMDLRVWWGGNGSQVGGWTPWDQRVLNEVPNSRYYGDASRTSQFGSEITENTNTECVYIPAPSSGYWFVIYNKSGIAASYDLQVSFLRNL